MRSHLSVSSLAVALFILGCGVPNEGELDGEEEILATQAISKPPSNAGFKHLTDAAAVAASYNCFGIIDGRLASSDCAYPDEPNFKDVAFSQYQAPNGSLNFCRLDSLALSTRRAANGQLNEVYTATCLDRSSDNSIKLVPNQVLSSRRAGSTSAFSATSGNFLLRVSNTHVFPLKLIVHRATGLYVTGKFTFDLNVPYTLGSLNSERERASQEFEFHTWKRCSITSSGWCMQKV